MKDTSIKAIPTEYNGTLYRSKLEARWAAYFDLCGAKFEYEPQAFELGDGIRYLPDFVVEDVLSVHGGCGDQTLENSRKYKRFWFECKGVMSEYDEVKIGKFRESIKTSKGPEGFYECPFLVLEMSPWKMFEYSESGRAYRSTMGDSDPFNFYPVDCDYFQFVIGKPVGMEGVGLFGDDSNYTCLMDGQSREFAKQVEGMFRWAPRDERD